MEPESLGESAEGRWRSSGDHQYVRVGGERKEGRSRCGDVEQAYTGNE
jgi:hypothetical protein